MNQYSIQAFAVLAMFGLGLGSRAYSQQSDSDAETIKRLNKSLTFAATFDEGPDAVYARGDRRIYHASSVERKDPKPGLPAGDMEIVNGQGRHGSGALRFSKKSNKVVFYKALDNVAYRKENFSGTVSFWLNLDPSADLGDWYCDPIQITEKAWNNAALWVDFSKDEKPKLFRLGAFADLKVWNPENRDYEKMTPAERPMVAAKVRPFARGRWTHVGIAFENFNTGKPDGKATLYINGKPDGEIAGRNQTFRWEMDKAAIQIGIAYVGLFDDLMLFDRTLNAAEMEMLHRYEERLTGPR